MEHRTVILIIGALFIGLGLAGALKFKETETSIIKGWLRVVSFIIGTFLLIIGLFGLDTFKSKSIDETTKSGFSWTGKWYIVWNYNDYFYEPTTMQKEHLMEIQTKSDTLQGA